MNTLRLIRNSFFPAVILAVAFQTLFAASPPNASDPPFKPELLKPISVMNGSGKSATLYDPKDPYAIFINYELGMHCVGFDISYCCIIPPYNSIQAQAVRTGEGGRLPHLLTPDDGLSLAYFVRDNSYSEGNKMKYWSVLKDANGNGTVGDPNDNMANYVWTHLFIYKDLAGTLPQDWTKEKRLHIGLGASDVFLNVVGGLGIREPAADLGVVAAVLSSVRDLPVDPGWAFFGEVGLGGEIRAVGQADRRLTELHRLGFHRAIAAKRTREGLAASPIETLGLSHVGELRELFAATGKKRFDG